MANKFYAVRSGRNGPNIYTTWAETDQSVRAFPGARHKSFKTEALARDWLEDAQETQRPVKREAGPEGTYDEPVKKKRGFCYSLWLLSIYIRTDFTATVNSLPSVAGPAPHGQNVSKPPSTPIKTLNSITEDEFTAKFSPEQQEVFDAVCACQSLFFTGSAGLYILCSYLVLTRL